MKIALSTTELLIAILCISFGILSLILLLRWALNKSSKKDFSKRVIDRIGERTKYLEVNPFRYRKSILGVSFISTLAALLFLFNWTQYGHQYDIPVFIYDIEEEIEQIPPPTQKKDPIPPSPTPDIVPMEELEQEDLDLFKDRTIPEEPTLNESSEQNIETDEVVTAPIPLPEPKDEPDDLFVVVEQMPRFPGCEDIVDEEEKKQCSHKKLLEFIYDNIKYPALARENGIEGLVVVGFVVEGDGTVSAAEVRRDIGAGCGEEAVRVVKLMNELNKRWIPGKQRGRSVRVQFNLPVKFQLQ